MPDYLKEGQAGLYLLDSFKRQTVSTLFGLWIRLVSTYGNRIQRAQILSLLMILALVYSTADCLIAGMHKLSSFEV